MLATHLGFFNTATTRTAVRFQFSTHAAAGGNVAPNSAFEAADIRIYRANDSAAFSATQRSSANGITMTSPFDSLTGFHDVNIDLTDNTDAGFYAAGYTYSVVLAPDETVDGQTLTGIVLAYFEIGVPVANVTQFGGTAGTFSGGRPEVNTTLIEGSDATNQIRDAVVDDATRIDASALNTATGTTIPTNLNATVSSRASQTSVDTIDDFLDTEVAAILADTNELQTDWANGGRLDNILDARASQTSVDTVDTVVDGIAAAVGTPTNFGSGTSTIAANLQDLADNGTATFDRSTDSLQAIRDRGDAAWGSSGGISAQDVWEYAIASSSGVSGSTAEALAAAGGAGDPWITALPGSYSAGQAGYIIGTNLNATVSSRATQTSVDTIDGIVDSILVDTAEIGAAGAGLTEAGGTGDQLTAVPWNAAWDAEVQSEATDALNAYDPPTRAEATSDANSILAAVGDVPTNSELATALAGADDAVLAAIAALNNLSAAQVNAEVVDALNVDTYAEPGQGSPGATIALTAKIGYLYKAWRNRTTQTASEYALYNDDGTTKGQEAAISDNGTTLDRAEVTTGA